MSRVNYTTMVFYNQPCHLAGSLASYLDMIRGDLITWVFHYTTRRLCYITWVKFRV